MRIGFFDNLRTIATGAARAIAPDVFGTGPLHVAHFRELGIRTKSFGGLYTRRLDLMFQQQLVDMGRWDGPGNCILINTDSLVRRGRGHSRWARAARRREVAAAYHGVVLHELAHVLDDDYPRLALDAGEQAARGLEFRLALVDRGISEERMDAVRNSIRLPRWFGHGQRFIRLAMHLAVRALAAGIDVAATDVIETMDYGLSSTAAYVAALGREPERIAGWPIARIKATAAPAFFQELFESDTRAAQVA